MKLAEALISRADHLKRIERLKLRLLQNAKVQEGDKPAEKPNDLIKEIERLSDSLARLIQRINSTNSVTVLDAGVKSKIFCKFLSSPRISVYSNKFALSSSASNLGIN